MPGPIIKDNENARPISGDAPAAVDRDKITAPTRDDLDRAYRMGAHAADVYAGEPKTARLAGAKIYRGDDGVTIVLSDLGDGRSSVVIETATGRSHTWGPTARIVELAKRLGMV